MTLAAIDWLSISINLLLVIFVIVCLLMTLLILMQRPKQEGLGAAFGGGVTDQVFGARTTNVLQRGTVYLGSMFFLLALLLAILIGHQNKSSGLTDEKKPKQEQGGAAEVPAVPAEAPKSLGEELPQSLLEELPQEADAPESTSGEASEPSAPAEAPAEGEQDKPAQP